MESSNQPQFEVYLMLTRIQLSTLSLSILTTLSVSAYASNNAPTAKHIDKIVVFGDSLSDNGNDDALAKNSLILKRVLTHYNFQTLPPWPYKYGRFSNGETWAENLAYGYFHLSNNTAYNPLNNPIPATSLGNKARDPYANFIDYAYGEAWAERYSRDLNPGHKSKLKQHLFPYDLNTQVDMYTKKYIRTKANSKPDTTLYFIWTGANDYLHGSRGGTAQADSAAVNNVMKYIGEAVDTLVKPITTKSGSGAKNIVLVDLPDLSQTPWGLSDTLQMQQELHRLSLDHDDAALKTLAAKMQNKYPDVHIHFIDVMQKFEDITKHPKKYQLNPNTIHQACVTPIATSPLVSPLNIFGYYADIKTKLAKHCINPADHLYFDHIHPTEHSHRLLAQYICQNLASAGYQYFNSNKNSAAGFYAPLDCSKLGKPSYDTSS